MSIQLRSKKRNRGRTFSPNYDFRAPPYDSYGAFRPEGYCKLFHRVEAEKMKRSHYWAQYVSNAEIFYKIKEFQEDTQLLKTYIEEGISKIEIEKCDEEIIEKIPDTISIIED